MSVINQAQGVRGLVAKPGQDSNVWLVGEQNRDDFLVTAVHEAWHLKGHGHDQQLVQAAYDAWARLSSRDRREATFTAEWLYS